MDEAERLARLDAEHDKAPLPGAFQYPPLDGEAELPPAPDSLPPVALDEDERAEIRARLKGEPVHRVKVVDLGLGRWKWFTWDCVEPAECKARGKSFTARARAAEDAGEHGVVIV
jgi:hypothetical protein